MGSFDTWMAGDPSSVEAAADWLGSVRSSMIPAAENTSRIRIKSGNIWEGNAADAYRDFNKDMTRALDQAVDQLTRINDLFLSYAQQLRWRQEDMQQHRDNAITGGLVVNGTIVMEPTPMLRPSRDPNQSLGAYLEAQRKYDEFCERVDLYARLREQAAKTFQRLADWIALNLVPGREETRTPSLAAEMSEALPALEKITTFWENSLEQAAKELRERATEKAAETTAIAAANPLVHPSEVKLPAEAMTKTAESRTLAEDLALTSKFLRRTGGVVAVAAAGFELSQGASPSAVTVGVLGGIIGSTAIAPIGAAVGAFIGGGTGSVLGPSGAVGGGLAGTVLGTAVGAVIGASIGDQVSRHTYQHTISQHTREMIDEGMRDTWSAFLRFEILVPNNKR